MPPPAPRLAECCSAPPDDDLKGAKAPLQQLRDLIEEKLRAKARAKTTIRE